MKPYLLFPRFLRPIGIAFALIGLVLGYIYLFPEKVSIFADHGSGSFTDELGTTFEVIGLMFIGFSRVKNEDERSSRLRLEALYWGVMTDLLLLFAWLTLNIVDEWLHTELAQPFRTWEDYNMFVILLIFVGRFYYVLFISKSNNNASTLPLLPYKPYVLIVRIVCVIFFILICVSSEFSAADDLIKKFLPYQLFILFPVCLIIWLWSKEKNETVPTVRLKAMQIAAYISYTLFLIATWAIYGFAYWEILFEALISTPVIFLVVFYLLLRVRKNERIEVETPNL